MSRCKRCGAHTIIAKRYDNECETELDFMPTSAGTYVLTDTGYCGELTENEQHALAREKVNVLLFTKHDCYRESKFRI
jgi:hypothetical protein